MLRSAKKELKVTRRENKKRHSDPHVVSLEKQNAGNTNMLVATPIRIAMEAMNNNNNNNNTFKKRAVVNGDVVLRSASSVGKEDVGRKTVGRRSIDSIRRLSGGQRRPESLNEGTISRNSDPSSATSALASSMASLKALFGVGGDAAEPLGFRRIPSRRTPKKPAAASTRSDLTPKAKRQVRQRNNDTTPKSSSTFYTKSTRTIPAASLKADEKDSEVRYFEFAKKRSASLFVAAVPASADVYREMCLVITLCKYECRGIKLFDHYC